MLGQILDMSLSEICYFFVLYVFDFAGILQNLTFFVVAAKEQ